MEGCFTIRGALTMLLILALLPLAYAYVRIEEWFNNKYYKKNEED